MDGTKESSGRHTRRGRTTKLTPETTELICDAIRLGLTHKLATQGAGISLSAFYGWLARGRTEEEGIYRDFLLAVEKAEADNAQDNMAVIKEAAQEGRTWQAAAWTMERRHGYTKPSEAPEVRVVQEPLSQEQVEERLAKLPPELLRRALAEAEGEDDG